MALVKIHRWIDGVLHTVEHVFEEIEEAIEHVLGLDDDHDGAKVYDDDGNCVHSTGGGSGGTYP